MFSGIPLSKALYTLSFMFITAGASGLVLTAIYYIVSSYLCHIVEIDILYPKEKSGSYNAQSLDDSDQVR
jgi:predicted acyltransferase